jgi:hypothetical protein
VEEVRPRVLRDQLGLAETPRPRVERTRGAHGKGGASRD